MWDREGRRGKQRFPTNPPGSIRDKDTVQGPMMVTQLGQGVTECSGTKRFPDPESGKTGLEKAYFYIIFSVLLSCFLLLLKEWFVSLWVGIAVPWYFLFPSLLLLLILPFPVGFFLWELCCGVTQSRNSVGASGLDIPHDCLNLRGSDSAESPSQSFLSRCSWMHYPGKNRAKLHGDIWHLIWGDKTNGNGGAIPSFPWLLHHMGCVESIKAKTLELMSGINQDPLPIPTLVGQYQCLVPSCTNGLILPFFKAIKPLNAIPALIH